MNRKSSDEFFFQFLIVNGKQTNNETNHKSRRDLNSIHFQPLRGCNESYRRNKKTLPSRRLVTRLE